MKTIFYGILVFSALVIIGLFFLAKSSQNASPAGLINNQLAPCPEPANCVSSEADTEADKKVAAFSLNSWEKLPSIVADMGGEVTQTKANYLAAEFSSKTFKFVDDMEFRLADDAVHVRSASRVGLSDHGVNLARVNALRERLSK
ncbi:MAG: DUF1499 domain-containing protein [Pseudomonadota bacterium]